VSPTLTKTTLTKATVRALLAQIDVIADRGGNGTLDLPGSQGLDVTNLGKVFWPELKLTKGDLFRHYIRVAPSLLPALADRPLVMKRYPNGIHGQPFYQHRAAQSLPVSVRVAEVTSETETRPHIIGGDLLTLLYTAQLASISQDPWFSRAGSDDAIDHAAIDLDPPDGMPFERICELARHVRDELATVRATGFPKTSGSRGLHIYVPMPPGTPYEAGLIFCQIIATRVAQRHPKLATIERSLSARRGRIYVDFMQNMRGKTLASVYSARANEFAGVSTPLTWEEVEGGVSPRDFTIPTFEARLAEAGDLWQALRRAKGVNLQLPEGDAPVATRAPATKAAAGRRARAK
jgi:bifunctional non-homologous end joining protein LigD